MRHTLLGPSGLRVSELCLGTLTFGEMKPWGADADTAHSILGTFADAGGTFIDTAPNYGGGAVEEIVGSFVRARRNDFVVATKYTASPRAHPLAGGNSRKSLRHSVEGSLARLGTDHIDLMWLHYWDGTTATDEILRALDDLVSAGKILYIGISDTPAWLTARAATVADLRGLSPVIATQLEYNLAVRTPERGLLPMADALGLGVVCWGPLAAGALVSGPNPRRRSAAALPPALAEARAAVAKLSAQTGLKGAALALGWLRQRPDGSAIIPVVGARTPEQMADTIASASNEIDITIVEALDAIAPPSLGFPHELIGSAYLRKLALGDESALVPPRRARA